MPVPIDHGHTLHSLYMRGQPLGIECRSCGRRATLFDGEVEAFKGNMRELRSFKLMCQTCGSREWSGWLFGDAADRAAFICAAGRRPAF